MYVQTRRTCGTSNIKEILKPNASSMTHFLIVHILVLWHTRWNSCTHDLDHRGVQYICTSVTHQLNCSSLIYFNNTEPEEQAER